MYTNTHHYLSLTPVILKQINIVGEANKKIRNHVELNCGSIK